MRVVGRGAKIGVDRQQQSLTEHALDDVLARADNIVVFVADLNLGKHRLVDIEGGVENLHLLTRLCLVPIGERVEDIVHVDVVRPVVNLERVSTVGCRSREGHAQSE